VWAWGGGGRKPPWIARPASQHDSVRAPVRSSAGQLGRRRSTASGVQSDELSWDVRGVRFRGALEEEVRSAN
jgi:hypothetical protein